MLLVQATAPGQRPAPSQSPLQARDTDREAGGISGVPLFQECRRERILGPGSPVSRGLAQVGMWFPGVDLHGKRWLAANLWVLRALAAALVAGGIAGFLVPPHLSPDQQRGALQPVPPGGRGGGAGGVTAAGRPGLVASFNLLFGLFNLWQAVAGPANVFPAQLFDLRPADHFVHVVVGTFLVYVGGRGAAALGAPWR